MLERFLKRMQSNAPAPGAKKKPAFSPAAYRRWSEFDAATQRRILGNVWCGRCRTGTTIVDYVGKMERGDVILEGRCAKCGSQVARVIESE